MGATDAYTAPCRGPRARLSSAGMPSFSDSELFSKLDTRDRDRLEALAKLDRFEAGQQIVAGGEKSEWLSLIVTGGIDLSARVEGRDVVLAPLGPGALFGEVETFGELPPSVRHIARQETFVRAIPKNPLR